MRRLPGLLAVLAGGLLLTAANPARGATPAAPADALADSVGVNVHMSYDDTPYRDVRRVADALGELGVRHVRDGAQAGRPDQYAALRALAARGIRVNLIVGDPRARAGPLEVLIPTIERELAGAVESLEGANEHDLSGDPQWASALRAHQRALYERAKASPALRGLPVLGPALGRVASFATLGSLAAWTDFGNAHPYPGGRTVTAGHLAEQFGLVAKVAPGRPVIATETGYHTTRASVPDHPSVSEPAAAADLPRLVLEHYAAGIGRTYLYELLDVFPRPADMASNFGLLRNDLSPKPAFHALRNLLALFADDGRGGPAAASLGYGIGGDAAAIRQLLFARSDGTLLLALWHDAPAYDTMARRDVSTARTATVAFDRRMPAVRVHRPTLSAQPVAQHAKVQSVTLTIASDPIVLELPPAPAPPLIVPASPARATAPTRCACRIVRRAGRTRRVCRVARRVVAGKQARWRITQAACRCTRKAKRRGGKRIVVTTCRCPTGAKRPRCLAVRPQRTRREDRGERRRKR